MGRAVRRRLAAAFLLSALLLAAGCGRAEETRTVIGLPESTGEAQSADAAEAPPEYWYGWWGISEGTGDWIGKTGCWWDCCARMTKDKDGALTLLIWDEDTTRTKSLAKLKAKRVGEMLLCTGGTFMSAKPGDDCEISLAADKAGDLLTVTGAYSEAKKGSFRYSLTLRPWGQRWDEDGGELPYYYESWYLPLIEKGLPMPEKIGK